MNIDECPITMAITWYLKVISIFVNTREILYVAQYRLYTFFYLSESSCAHCDEKFSDNSALQSHLADTHPDLVKPEKDAPLKVTPSKVTTKKMAGKKVTTPKHTSEVHACDTCNRNYPSL